MMDSMVSALAAGFKTGEKDSRCQGNPVIVPEQRNWQDAHQLLWLQGWLEGYGVTSRDNDGNHIVRDKIVKLLRDEGAHFLGRSDARANLLKRLAARRFMRENSFTVIAKEVWQPGACGLKDRIIDVLAAKKDGRFMAVEVKQSTEDLFTELKTPGKWLALDWCDEFYLAVMDDVWQHMGRDKKDIFHKKKGGIRLPREWGVFVAKPVQKKTGDRSFYENKPWHIDLWQLRLVRPAERLPTAENPKQQFRWWYLLSAATSGRCINEFQPERLGTW